MQEKKPLTVSALSKYLKYTFDHDDNLQNVLLKGEISNFKHHSRGHFYFTLKDETAQISAVMFNREASGVTFNVEDGMKVIVEGYVSLYVQGGSYQIYVKSMSLDGIGELYLRFEQLKEKLFKLGLFDEPRKRPLPLYPKRIGVITSNTGAAIRDILTTLERRYPLVEVIVFPTLVQGEFAKQSIMKSINLANNYGGIEVIILGRGGGSIEDLWCFNEEEVALAISQSQIPIISAVGHETDWTISDFVSDKRAATPTAAAELAVPSRHDLLIHLNQLKQRLTVRMVGRIKQDGQILERVKRSVVFTNPRRIYEQNYFQLDRFVSKLHQHSPKNQIELKQSQLSSLFQRLNHTFSHQVQKRSHQFSLLTDKLELVNPLNLLNKGYSLVKRGNENMSSIKDISVQDTIQVMMKDGHLDCLVVNKEVK
jgi:exodeoxyribonuclease VII large subunit